MKRRKKSRNQPNKRIKRRNKENISPNRQPLKRSTLKSRMEQNLKELGLEGEILQNKSKVKISALVLEYGSDFIEKATNQDEIEKAIMTIIVGWNLGVEEEKEREFKLRKFVETVTKPGQKDIEEILDYSINKTEKINSHLK